MSAGRHAWLVIGCGSDLRRDDALGRLVAERLEEVDLPDVRVLSVHQLGPKLIEDMQQAEACLVIDAYPARPGEGLCLERVEAGEEEAPEAGAFRHVVSPAGLLPLCRSLYGRCPALWVLGLPAFDLGLGEGLGPGGCDLLEEAVRTATGLLSGPPPGHPTDHPKPEEH